MLRKSIAVASCLLMTIACGKKSEATQVVRNNMISLQTQCVGRYLVDLPSELPVLWTQNFDASVATRLTSITSYALFRNLVLQKKEAIGNQRHEVENSLLGRFLEVGGNAALLAFRGDKTATNIYQLHRFIWIGDRGYLLANEVLTNDLQRLEMFANVLDHIFSRPTVPSTPGFCIDGALVTGEWGQMSASATASVKAWPTMRLAFNSGEDSETVSSGRTLTDEDFRPFVWLQKEQDKIKALASLFPDQQDDPALTKEFHVLLRRERVVDHRKGEEVAWRDTLNSGAVLYKFYWSNTDASGKPETPGVALEMEAGDRYKPELGSPPEDQLLALWEAVLSSVRHRPGA